MSNYIIHACPDRMWYVEDYLVPSMKEQGIKNVSVRCDENGVGNLENCMQIFQSLPDEGGTWHMQDDVLICRDFRKRTEKLTYGVICGFVSETDQNVEYDGFVISTYMWWSFPCIHIPNKLAKDCANWFYNSVRTNMNYDYLVKEGKNDDWFFKEYIRIFDPSYQILNLSPCLVDHVDYLIGGTTINKERKNQHVMAKYFEDRDLVDELEKKIGERKS